MYERSPFGLQLFVLIHRAFAQSTEPLQQLSRQMTLQNHYTLHYRNALLQQGGEFKNNHDIRTQHY